MTNHLDLKMEFVSYHPSHIQKLLCEQAELKSQVVFRRKNLYDQMQSPLYNAVSDKKNQYAKMDATESKVLIAKETTAITEMEKRIAQITRWVTEAEKIFIPDLQKNAAILCRNLQKTLSVLKHKYESLYPENQSEMFEIGLFELEYRANQIVAPERHDDLVRQNNEYLVCYFLLCGFLWRIRDLLCEAKHLSEAEENLANEIFHILKSTHIHRDDDLPDDMAIGKGALQFYVAKYPDLSVSGLKESQLERYVLAKQEFEAALGTSTLATPQMQVLGKKMLQLIDEQKNQSIRFSTAILSLSKKLITQREDTPSVFTQYGLLIDKALGKPSSWKKIAGCMLGLAGVALIGLSVFAAFATLGVGAPISILGMTWGAGLAMVGYTYLTGLAVLSAGEYTLLKGVRHGLSSQMQHYHEAAKQRTGHLSMFHPSKKQIELSRLNHSGVQGMPLLNHGLNQRVVSQDIKLTTGEYDEKSNGAGQFVEGGFVMPPPAYSP